MSLTIHHTESLMTLKNFIDAIHPFSDEEWNLFSKIWEPFSAKRKELLTSAGDTEKYLYFVVSGTQRVFYLDDQNREATLVFTYPPSFGGVLDSMIQNNPSKYYYETLSTSTFLRCSFQELEKMRSTVPAIKKLIEKGLSHTLSGLLERLVEVQCYSAEDRFKKLLHRSPHILQMVPHKYLANYIGIDPTNFSKLLNSVKI